MKGSRGSQGSRGSRTAIVDKQAGAQVRRYIATLPPRSRRAMRALRTLIRSAAPGAVDAYSYRIAAMRLDGRIFIWYAGWKEHCSMYPVTAALLRARKIDVGDYDVKKGTIRFPLDKPLPAALIRRIVKARVAEHRERHKL